MEMQEWYNKRWVNFEVSIQIDFIVLLFEENLFN